MRERESVYEIVVRLLRERFGEDERLAELAISIFEEYLCSGRRGVERLIERELARALGGGE